MVDAGAVELSVDVAEGCCALEVDESCALPSLPSDFNEAGVAGVAESDDTSVEPLDDCGGCVCWSCMAALSRGIIRLSGRVAAMVAAAFTTR